MAELVFLVETDDFARRVGQDVLELAGYRVRTFPSTDAVLAEAHAEGPAAITIGAAPSDEGISLCREVRQDPRLSKVRLLLMIESFCEVQQLSAFDAGADDCVYKPVTPRDFVTSVQAMLRRNEHHPHRFSEVDVDLVIDNAAMKLLVRGQEVETTTLEFRLVDYLAKHRGQVFTRDLLLDAVWGETQFVSPRSVDACIRRVRGKIELDKTAPTYLKTIRGVGYRFDAVAAWPNRTEICTCVACVSALSRSRSSPTQALLRKRAVG